MRRTLMLLACLLLSGRALADLPAPKLVEVDRFAELATACDREAAPTLLSYHPTVGSSWQDRVSQSSRIAMSGEGLPSSAYRTETGFTLIGKALSSDAKGTTVEMRVSEPSASTIPTLEEPMAQTATALDGYTYHATFSPRAVMTGMVPQEPFSPDIPASWRTARRQSWSPSLSFPETPVAPGAEWQAVDELKDVAGGEKAVPYRTTSTYRFEGLVEENGRRHALLSMMRRREIGGRLTGDAQPGTLAGDGWTWGYALWDVEGGFLREMRTRTRIESGTKLEGGTSLSKKTEIDVVRTRL